jgi:small subunit ribosomal protein S17
MADEETKDAETELAADAAPLAPEEPEAEAPVELAEPTAEAEHPTDDSAGAEPTDDAAGEPEEEPAAAQTVAAVSDTAPPVEILHPKERRRRVRQRSAEPARPSLAPEERQTERDALRKQNAKARAERRRKVRAKKPAATATAAVAEPRVAGTQKTRQGIVVSDKAAKTITVRIDTSRRHRRYQKIVRSTKSLHAHDEHDEAHEGDLVRLIETRPLSATKRWRLAEILERAR